MSDVAPSAAPRASRRLAGTPAAFAAATLAPGAAIGLGAVAGGWWAGFALVLMTGAVAVIDRLAPQAAAGVPGAEFPAAPRLLAVLGALHLALIPLTVWAVSGDSGLSSGARVALFLAAGLWLGQVGHAAAHELIHRGERGLFALGAAAYTALLFGHHASAHRLVHHRFVATPDDPSTAAAGVGFWAFAPRAWAGSFRAGAEMETALRRRAPAGARGVHPYVWWVGGGAAALCAVLWAFGVGGAAAYVALCLHAQMQILLSDYVQHYGLERRALPGGRYEPVGPAHAWEARAAGSGAMLLHAGRHADHHAHPHRAFPDLVHDGGAPRLPFGMPAMGAIALIPPLWRRLMDPRLARLRRPGSGGVAGP